MSKFKRTKQRQNEMFDDICDSMESMAREQEMQNKVLEAKIKRKRKAKARRRHMAEGRIAVNLLVVDCDDQIYNLVSKDVPKVNGTKINAAWAKGYEEARQKLNDGSFDLMIIVGNIACGNLSLLLKLCPKCSTIVLGCEESYDEDMRAMKAGAVDFLDRAKISAKTLEKSIRYCLKR